MGPSDFSACPNIHTPMGNPCKTSACIQPLLADTYGVSVNTHTIQAIHHQAVIRLSKHLHPSLSRVGLLASCTRCCEKIGMNMVKIPRILRWEDNILAVISTIWMKPPSKPGKWLVPERSRSETHHIARMDFKHSCSLSLSTLLRQEIVLPIALGDRLLVTAPVPLAVSRSHPISSFFR